MSPSEWVWAKYHMNGELRRKREMSGARIFGLYLGLVGIGSVGGGITGGYIFGSEAHSSTWYRLDPAPRSVYVGFKTLEGAAIGTVVGGMAAVVSPVVVTVAAPYYIAQWIVSK